MMTSPMELHDCRLPDSLTIQLMPERDTVLKRMTAPGKPEEVLASLTTVTEERIGLEHTETLRKESPPGQAAEKAVFPASAPLPKMDLTFQSETQERVHRPR